MQKVAITTSSFGRYDKEPLEILKGMGMRLALNPFGRKMTKDEIIEVCKDAVGIIAGTEILDQETIKRLTKLRVISRCGSGLDNVDIDAAGRAGIKVFNTPDAPTRAVAELTVGLILACLRGIVRADRIIRKGSWEKPMGELLQSKTVGIIGYGRIGRAVSRLMQAFDAEVIAYDIVTISETAGARLVSFDEVLTMADIITIHVSPKPFEKPIITAEDIAKMKKGSYLINTSRGGLVDEEALYHALKTKKLSAAALDTFQEEPYHGPLGELDNIVLTSHIGSYAQKARILMEKQAVENLLEGLR